MTRQSVIAFVAAAIAGASFIATVDAADARHHRPGHVIKTNGKAPAKGRPGASGYCHVTNPACPQGQTGQTGQNNPTVPRLCGQRKCEPGENPAPTGPQRPRPPGF